MRASRSRGRTVLGDARRVDLAKRMIRCGARLQVLAAETGLSYERLSNLYHEVRGASPSKGLLPFSEGWYLSWKANLHSSFFYSLYLHLKENEPDLEPGERLVKAYELYCGGACGVDEQAGAEPLLSFTRAWILVRFIEHARTLALSHCSNCGIGFVTRAHMHHLTVACPVCHPAPRALAALHADPVDDGMWDEPRAPGPDGSWVPGECR